MNFTSIPSPDKKSNPVISLMCDALNKSGLDFVAIRRFTIRWVLKKGRKLDLLILHWPQMMFRGNGCIHSSIKFSYFILRIILLKMFGVKIVWIAHNVLPHESRCVHLEVLFRRIFLERCNAVVGMSSCCKSALESTLGSSGQVYIQSLLGHYGGCYGTAVRANEIYNFEGLDDKIRFLLFGSYRANKGLEEFIAEWELLETHKCVLLVAGVWPKELEMKYASKRVQFVNKFIPDQDVAMIFVSSDWIVLPYEEYTTSAIYTLAITYKKPVLARNSDYALKEITHGLGLIYRQGALEKAVVEIQRGDVIDERALAIENKRRDWDRIAKDLVERLQTI